MTFVGTPPETGNSQSKSSPSKPYASIIATHDSMKSSRAAGDAAASEKWVDSVHPPTDSTVRRWGCAALSSVSCPKLPLYGMAGSSPG